jgi:hypothetical protein
LDLGEPDLVFLQNQNGDVVILVWLDPDEPERVRLSLHLLGPHTWGVEKFQPQAVAETSVNGQSAVWTTGPYPLIFRNGDLDSRRLLEGHVLIWSDSLITYRLETDLSLDEAVHIAESIQ